MTTINELRTTDRTIRYREMMSRRLKALESENAGLKLELERARAALVHRATQVAAAPAAKLTKRSAALVGQVLVPTGKPVKVRAAQNVAAWQAVVAACGSTGATATVLAQLPALAVPACISPQVFISYMVRRGYLQVKAAERELPAERKKIR